LRKFQSSLHHAWLTAGSNNTNDNNNFRTILILRSGTINYPPVPRGAAIMESTRDAFMTALQR
jgi:hypothetical protein